MDKSRVEPTILFIEKISFSLKLFFGHFYGQSFIKTVRGPLLTHMLILLGLAKLFVPFSVHLDYKCYYLHEYVLFLHNNFEH